jgi:hypothetical protein
VAFRAPVQVALLRAHFGKGPAVGVPILYRWEALESRPGATECSAVQQISQRYLTILGATGVRTSSVQAGVPGEPTHQSWFVDVAACALRLVIDKTNSGPPVIRQVYAYQGARNVLLGATAKVTSAARFDPQAAIDGRDDSYWMGKPGVHRWTLGIALAEPTPLDRVRLVLGEEAVSRPRGRSGTEPGRSYGVSRAPLHYALEVSEDGTTFARVASTPLTSDGHVLPLRRRLITLSQPRPVRSLRLVMDGATGSLGLRDAAAAPVVREIAAYRSDDRRPVIPHPWLLSVNANPAPLIHRAPGGEAANDAHFAGFVRQRFAAMMPGLREDTSNPPEDPGEHPQPTARHVSPNQLLETIEGDDPMLNEALLGQSSPPPITVLSGSNRWEYPIEVVRDQLLGPGWTWDPLRDAQHGGMGQLHLAVKNRVAPFLGFCGGAQLLALLEAKPSDDTTLSQDVETIDRIIRRTSGRPLRTPAPNQQDIETAWPNDGRPRVEVTFNPYHPLFHDFANLELGRGPARDRARSFPKRHENVVRPDAFLPNQPLASFVVVGSSQFCGPDVVAAGPRDPALPNPRGPGQCIAVPEVFRSRTGSYPIVATQFHPEQSNYSYPAPGDPPESVDDPSLFLAAVYEQMVDAYLANAR